MQPHARRCSPLLVRHSPVLSWSSDALPLSSAGGPKPTERNAHVSALPPSQNVNIYTWAGSNGFDEACEEPELSVVRRRSAESWKASTEQGSILITSTGMDKLPREGEHSMSHNTAPIQEGESSGVHSCVQDLVNELDQLRRREYMQKALEEDVYGYEAFAQNLESLSLKASSTKLKRLYIEAAVANTSECTKSSRARLVSARDEYVVALRKQLVQGENEARRQRELRQKRIKELEDFSLHDGAENRTSRCKRMAINDLKRYLAAGSAAVSSAEEYGSSPIGHPLQQVLRSLGSPC